MTQPPNDLQKTERNALQKIEQAMLTGFAWLMLSVLLVSSLAFIVAIGATLLALGAIAAGLSLVCSSALLLPTLLGEMLFNPKAALKGYYQEVAAITTRVVDAVLMGLFEALNQSNTVDWQARPVGRVFKVLSHTVTTVFFLGLLLSLAGAILTGQGVVAISGAIYRLPRLFFEGIQKGIKSACLRYYQPIDDNCSQFNRSILDFPTKHLPEAFSVGVPAAKAVLPQFNIRSDGGKPGSTGDLALSEQVGMGIDDVTQGATQGVTS